MTTHNILMDVLTPAEVEDLYNVGARWVQELCQQGQLPCRKSGRAWLVDAAAAKKRWGRNSAPQKTKKAGE